MRRLLGNLLHPQPQLRWFGRTDTGRVRDHNEDAFCILEDRRLLLVADGMGGHNAGEVASRLALELLVKRLSPGEVRKCLGNPHRIRHLLVSGFRQANQEVRAAGEGEESLRGMGCTLLAGLFDREILHTCHVGDTRCYRMETGGLRQVTADHSVAACPGSGTAHEGAAPSRHVITRAIGFPWGEDPEYHAFRLAPGERLLFCSDGLWSMVALPRLEAILAGAASPEQACDHLVAAANEAGGRDNITAVVVFV
ncbi:MAG: protein phosphatase 2C domain-containing protein [Desulfobacteraceae bacterium]|nr:protein phosphatase 2C domain-containing protein [Desulfobacteraceae bacterium]